MQWWVRHLLPGLDLCQLYQAAFARNQLLQLSYYFDCVLHTYFCQYLLIRTVASVCSRLLYVGSVKGRYHIDETFISLYRKSTWLEFHYFGFKIDRSHSCIYFILNILQFCVQFAARMQWPYSCSAHISFVEHTQNQGARQFNNCLKTQYSHRCKYWWSRNCSLIKSRIKNLEILFQWCYI